jgi:predicted aspartyl protease
MKSIPLQQNGAAVINVSIAMRNSATMVQRRFLVDTGATRTTIPKKMLVDALDYTDDYIRKNKIQLSERDKPLMADGKRADVYMMKAPRINIGGHEIQSDYILTSDTIESLNLLLGLDILRFFKFTYDFDALDENAPHGRMFYEFRESCIKPFVKLGKPFAYKLFYE